MSKLGSLPRIQHVGLKKEGETSHSLWNKV